jgi:ATP-dependent helicase/nuclease subunit A
MTTAPYLSIDPNQQQRVAASPEASVWVSASAGTGKTKVLTDRVLSLLLTGTKPQRILCLTFTRAAAAEMESRIADQLGKWTMAEEGTLRAQLENLLGEAPKDKLVQHARQLFAHVLDAPGGMNIQTIHAFCQSLLGRFPLEAGVPPHFALMDERDAEEMLIAAREDLLNHARSGADESLASALAEVTAHIHEAQFPELLAELTYARGRLRRLIEQHGSIDAVVSNLQIVLSVKPSETPDGVLAAASESEAYDELGLRLAVTALAAGTKTDQARGQIIQNWLEENDRSVAGFDAYADGFLTSARKNGAIEIRKRLLTKKVAENTPGVQEILEQEAGRLAHVLLHWRSVSIAKSTEGLLILGEALLATYQAQKEAKALLDYDDLILLAGELLHREGVAPWVLFKLDGGIDHVLVDEAQDTSPDQWRVIEALAEEFFVGLSAHETPPTIFAVGDVKQSIYSFQGADPITFGRMRDLFAGRAKAAEQIWRPVDLTVSFRSTQAVLSAVDAVFKMPNAADGVTLDDGVIHHEAWRANEGGLVELWPPVEPREADAPSAWKPPVERIRGDAPQTRLAGLIAGRIAKMIHDKEILEAKGRPIEAGDVMVLVRRRSGFVEDLVRSLKELEIDVAGVDRMVLTEQMAVMDLLALGQFLLLPEDNLTLATVLKSPLIGLNEEQLYELAYNRDGSLWQVLGRNTSDPIFTSAHDYLMTLLASADYVPPFELYSEILGAREGREKLVARLGPDALDPISEFLNLALVYEKSHVASLEGFLNWVAAGDVQIKRDLEQATQNAVRVMTVHGAKGLQAPIVFLPDTLQVPMQGSTLFWPQDVDGQDETLLWPPRRGLYEGIAEIEREAVGRRRDQEYRRLLYVAMTRAEDRLYVCGWHTRSKAPEHCWYNLIEAGLADIGEEIPDEYLASAGETESSAVLRLTSPQTAETEQAKQSPVDEYADLPDWASLPPEADPLPPSPLTPSKPEGEEPVILSPLESDDGARFKRGRLIHALLQTLPDIEIGKREEALKSFLARGAHELTPVQQTEITAEIITVLGDPDFAPIFGPGSRAEVPLVGKVAGQIMSAQLDRLLVTDNEILVVDFKTNRPPPTDPAKVAEIYLRQMAAYRVALQEIYPGKEIKCALLWTVGPQLMPLTAEQLKAYEPKGV